MNQEQRRKRQFTRALKYGMKLRGIKRKELHTNSENIGDNSSYCINLSESVANKILSEETDYFPSNSVIKKISKLIGFHEKAVDFSFENSCEVVDAKRKIENLFDVAILFNSAEDNGFFSTCLHKNLDEHFQGYNKALKQYYTYEDKIRCKNSILETIGVDYAIYYDKKLGTAYDFFKTHIEQMYWEYDRKPQADEEVILRAINGWKEFQNEFHKIVIEFFDKETFKNTIYDILTISDIYMNSNELAIREKIKLINKTKKLKRKNSIIENINFYETIEDEFFVKYAIIYYLTKKYFKNVPSDPKDPFNSRWEQQSDFFLCVKAIRMYFINMISKNDTKSCIF